jgi:hypothetical protein
MVGIQERERKCKDRLMQGRESLPGRAEPTKFGQAELCKDETEFGDSVPDQAAANMCH